MLSQTGADLTNLSILSQTLVNSIDQLNEFSYFKNDKLKLWMGPDRWKPLSSGAIRPKNAQVRNLGEEKIMRENVEECPRKRHGNVWVYRKNADVEEM